MTSTDSDFQTAVQTLYQSLLDIWTRYLDAGVGSVDEQLYQPFSAAAAEVTLALASSDEFDDSIVSLAQFQVHFQAAEKLARMCANTPQGLSFVTGEAGLIPRLDLHQQMQAAIDLFSRFGREGDKPSNQQ
jgi:hypothetical protein